MRLGLPSDCELLGDLERELTRRDEHERGWSPARGSMRWTIGTAKASVLPEPVGDLASTSRPARAEGMTRAWIWKGLMMSRALSALTTSALAPSAAKDCSCIRFFDSWFVGSRPDLPSSPFLGESKEARSHGATSCRPLCPG